MRDTPDCHTLELDMRYLDVVVVGAASKHYVTVSPISLNFGKKRQFGLAFFCLSRSKLAGLVN